MDDAGRLTGAFVAGALLLNAMQHLMAGVGGAFPTALMLARWFSHDGHGDG